MIYDVTEAVICFALMTGIHQDSIKDMTGSIQVHGVPLLVPKNVKWWNLSVCYFLMPQ